jgi:RND superfamily putative drug exporter
MKSYFQRPKGANLSKTTKTRAPHRKPLFIAIGLTVVWLGISSVTGPLFGNLSTVQKNDNSKFLPSSAEAEKFNVAAKAFSSGSNNSFPELVLFVGKADPAAIASANSFLQTLPSKPLVDINGKAISLVNKTIGDFLDTSAPLIAFPSKNADAILASVPYSSGKSDTVLANKKPALPVFTSSIRYYSAQYATSHGLQAHVTGIAAILSDLFGAFGSLDSSLLLTTGLVVAIILIIVYRSPILWILPLFSAGIALTFAGSVIYELAKHNIITLDGQSQGILSVLVLGGATDYALLLIARYREELHHVESRFEAMQNALRGVVEPIVASGSTVAVSLILLLLASLSNNRGLGPVGAIGILCAVITILTLLPAALVLFGRWIFWPRIPKFGSEDEKLKGIWAKLANATAKKSRTYWVATGLVLLIFAAFASTLHASGISTSQSFTKTPDSVKSQDVLLKYFSGGQGQPTQIWTTESSAAAITAKLSSTSGITSVVPDGVQAPGGTPRVVDGHVILNATLVATADSNEATNMIPAIRSAAHAIDPQSLVGGTSAVFYDSHQAAARDQRLIIPVVLLVIAIILGLLLRSVLASLMLLFTVVLSYLATLGACALVFHHIFHFAGEDSGFPLFAFIFLVALGIDYNIFLMTRVREEAMQIGTRAGMIKGVTVTGGVITSAGIVLAATFTVLGILPIVFLAEIGFSVAFGVLLDTFIVRSILVPALVHSIGPKIWWPSKLQKS